MKPISNSLSFMVLVFSMLCTGQAQSLNGYQYVSPKPNATQVPSNGTIILRFNALIPQIIANLETCISLSGTKSGEIILLQ